MSRLRRRRSSTARIDPRERRDCRKSPSRRSCRRRICALRWRSCWPAWPRWRPFRCSLAWPAALASTVLGALMVAGAEVDARTFLLPDTVTVGTLVSGVLAAPVLDPFDPGSSAAAAAARAFGTAAVLLLVRWGYARLRDREGLGFGDVKLAAGIGAWLPLDAVPVCFALAASAALIAVLMAHIRGRTMNAATKLPLGSFSVRRFGWSFMQAFWAAELEPARLLDPRPLHVVGAGQPGCKRGRLSMEPTRGTSNRSFARRWR